MATKKKNSLEGYYVIKFEKYVELMSEINKKYNIFNMKLQIFLLNYFILLR